MAFLRDREAAMMTQPEGDELLRKQVQRLENQVSALIYLTRSVLSLLERICAGEQVPMEQIKSIEKAIDSLTPRNRR